MGISNKKKRHLSPEIISVIESNFDLLGWFKKEKNIICGLLILVFLVYSNGLNNAFVSDDIGAIATNPNIGIFKIKQIHGIIAMLYYFLVYKIDGANPFVFRLMNVLFHSGSVVLLYLFFQQKFSKNLGILVASLFAVHPVLIESVTWISGGPYDRYTFLFLASFLIYISYPNNLKASIASGALFLLSVFTNEKAVPLFLAFPLYDLSFRGSIKNIKHYISHIFIAVSFSFASFGKIGERIAGLQTDYYVTETSGYMNPLIQIPIAVTEYLKLIFWPVDLTLYHSELSFSQNEYLIRLGIFLVFVGLVIYSYWRIRGKNFDLMIKFWKEVPTTILEIGDPRISDYKFILFWLLFFLISLSVTLTPLGIAWIVAERYVYLGSIGIFAVVGLLINKIAEKNENMKIFVYTVFAVAVVLLSYRTILRNEDWKSEDTLWIATAKTSPSSPNTHNNMGDVYGRHGDLENSAKEFQKAIELKPNYADAYHNLANTYKQMGKVDLAIENYQNAIKYNPNLWQSYQNLGIIYFEQKDYLLSSSFFEKTFSLNPNINNAYNLAVVYVKSGNNEQARKLLLDILAIDPTNQQVISILSDIGH